MVYKIMALQNIYLNKSKIAKILKVRRYVGTKQKNENGDIATAIITYLETGADKAVDVPLSYYSGAGDDDEKRDFDDEQDAKAPDLGSVHDRFGHVEFDDVIKFRAGDVVKYNDRYCHVLKIYEHELINGDDVEIVDRFELKCINDGEVIQHDYDNGNAMRIIHRNTFYIATMV